MCVQTRICFLWNRAINSYYFLKKTPSALVTCAEIFKQSIAARNQVGIGLSYRPARLHTLAELITWNQFLVFLKV